MPLRHTGLLKTLVQARSESSPAQKCRIIERLRKPLRDQVYTMSSIANHQKQQLFRIVSSGMTRITNTKHTMAIYNSVNNATWICGMRQSPFVCRHAQGCSNRILSTCHGACKQDYLRLWSVPNPGLCTTRHPAASNVAARCLTLMHAIAAYRPSKNTCTSSV